MKKFFLLFATIISLNNNTFADDGVEKKFRFGLRVTPTPTWLRSEQSKLVESSGVKFGFGFGLQTEFRITSTAHFVTGIGGDFLGGKQDYKNGQGYVLTKDDNYTDSRKTDWEKSPDKMASTAGTNKFYELNSRTVKISYITIPILLKLMTREMKKFKYFGVFGGNFSIQTKFRVTDEITELVFNSSSNQFETGGSKTLTDMRPSGDIIPISIGMNVGMGFEYYFSGTTAILFSVNYCRGFFSQYQPRSEIIVEKLRDNLNNSTAPIRSTQSAISDGVQINVGVLF